MIENHPFTRHLRSNRKLITSPLAREARHAAIFNEAMRLCNNNVLTQDKICERLAFQKMACYMISVFSIAGIKYKWRNRRTKTWHNQTKPRMEEAQFADGLFWKYEGKTRVLIFNLTVPLIKSNANICILNATPTTINENRLFGISHGDATTETSIYGIKRLFRVFFPIYADDLPSYTKQATPYMGDTMRTTREPT